MPHKGVLPENGRAVHECTVQHLGGMCASFKCADHCCISFGAGGNKMHKATLTYVS